MENLVFYDGICGICNRWIEFMIRRDPEARLRFAPLSGSTAALRLKDVPKPWPDALAFYSDGELRFKSEAVLLAMKGLPGAWSALAWLRILPQALRDLLYDQIAQRRYRIFGKLEACPLPRPEWKERFLP